MYSFNYFFLHPIFSFHLFIYPLSWAWSPHATVWNLRITGLLLHNAGPITSGYRWGHNLFWSEERYLQFVFCRLRFISFSDNFVRKIISHALSKFILLCAKNSWCTAGVPAGNNFMKWTLSLWASQPPKEKEGRKVQLKYKNSRQCIFDDNVDCVNRYGNHRTLTQTMAFVSIEICIKFM